MSSENNPFKNLNENQETPKDLKKDVMANIARAKLMLDLASLFTENYANSLKDLFKTKDNE